MKLVRKKEIQIEVCYDLSVNKNHNFFANGLCVHNTNAAIGITPNTEFWCQSRENIITPEKDNAGFAMFAYYNESVFQNIAADVCYLFDSNFTGVRDCLIFGEWCGQGIQKGVAVSELPKMFVVFGIAMVDVDGNKTYLTRAQVETAMTANTCEQIKCIYAYPTFSIEIDFEQPHEAQNVLNSITLQVEDECPVGKAHGVTGIGEGVVWRCLNEGFEDSGFWFKTKGEKHSKSKVKTLATVDVERINNINSLAERLAHEGRLEQMLQQVFDTLNGGEVDIKRTGDFIKAVMQDIFKEELDTIAGNGFTGKDINGPVSKIARDYLMRAL